jgi:hypothetical protein
MMLRTTLLGLLATIGLLAAGSISCTPAMARDVHKFSYTFSGEGSEEGKLKEPHGIAVNDTTHDVYVADQGNKRIEEFTATGAYIAQFAPPGGFEEVRSIAIDNSANPLDPSAGDVYAIDSVEHGRQALDKFSAVGVFEGQVATTPGYELANVATDPTGVVWVAERNESAGKEVTSRYSDDQPNALLSQIPWFPNERGFAVDSEDRLYRVDPGRSYQQLPPSGELHEFVTPGQATGLAVDESTNELYVSEAGSVGGYGIDGRIKESFGSGLLTETAGVAVDSATHMVYATDRAGDRVLAFEQVVVPDVETGEEPLNLATEGSATLGGTVNPDGIPVAACEFEYGPTSAYGSVAPCEPAPGAGNGPVAVHATVNGLTPLGVYHYRLVASNANGSNAGIDRSFTAPAPVKVGEEFALHVTAGSATLAGQVNPGGAHATFRFEYGPTTAYGESIAGEAGNGATDVEVSGHPQDLRAGTVYHFRLVAEGPLGPVAGEDRTLVTQPAFSPTALPDGRAWEMASPPNKEGAAIQGYNRQLIQAAADGTGITYGASQPTEASPQGSRSPENVQILSTRGSEGWTTSVVATPHGAEHVGVSVFGASEYKAFSSDLSLGLVEPKGFRPLSPEATERTVYLRHDGLCTSTPASCYQPLVTAANVAPGVEFGGPDETVGDVSVKGATSDLSHVVLGSSVALTPGGAPGLYEWTAGRLTFVGEMALGSKTPTVRRNAISDDGSRIVGTVNEEELVMRDVPTGTTTRLDIAEPGAAGGKGEPVFQTASADASRVFFTDTAPLTVDSGAQPGLRGVGKADLYECLMVSEAEHLRCALTDLTPRTGEEAMEAQGLVLGASEDGSYLYFVANGVLASGATPGHCGYEELTATCNLYVRHNGVTTLVARLSERDRDSFAKSSSHEVNLRKLTARVSPNGQWLAFMSERNLAGYDPRDAISGEPDEEVYLYHATAPPGKQLVCASCNPTNARPAGALDDPNTGLVDQEHLWPDRWVAALVPAWTGTEGDLSLYQSRYLSNSGRLFFDSHDALVPRDTNGTWDVYEYDPGGVGDCETSASAFSAISGGCVRLISSGGNGAESVFLDASETGDDVFFLTEAGLLPQDYDGAPDVYDAHACSESSPCLPAAAVSPPACVTADACRSAPAPQPGIFGAPSSQTFSGAGNVASVSNGSSAAPRPSAKGRKKRAPARGKCRARRSKHQRALCTPHGGKRHAKPASKPKTGKRSSRHGGR